MDMEREKEEQDKVLLENIEMIKSLKTSNEALKNDISEREQKIQLLESKQEEDGAKSREKSTEIGEKDAKIRELQLEVERKGKDFEDVSQQVEEVLQDIVKERQEKDVLRKEIEGNSIL